MHVPLCEILFGFKIYMLLLGMINIMACATSQHILKQFAFQLSKYNYMYL